jgi:hypothetical protein
MILQALLEVLTPPANPLELGDPGQWQQFEARYEVTLPDDYKAFVNTYGTGHIDEVIFSYNPFCQRPILKASYDYAKWLEEAKSINHLKQTYGEVVFPFPVYPEASGLLPWGSTDNGDRLYWQTTTRTDDWSVVVSEVRSDNFETLACSMTDFIRGLLTRDIRSRIIGPYIFEDRFFEPY